MAPGMPAAAPVLERVRFFPRQPLSPDDLNQVAEWFRERRRRHNRFLHGCGVVCGCAVTPAGGSAWQLKVSAGTVLTSIGEEIVLTADATIDVAAAFVSGIDPCASDPPCPPLRPRRLGRRRVVYVAIRYTETACRPVRAAAVPGCGDITCADSRTQECYQLCCLDTLPPRPRPYGCDLLCNQALLDCPAPAPDPGWVVLATIVLPDDTRTKIEATDISYGDRQRLYSLAMLREMAMCSCREQT